jgi:hypothetical protein
LSTRSIGGAEEVQQGIAHAHPAISAASVEVGFCEVALSKSQSSSGSLPKLGGGAHSHGAAAAGRRPARLVNRVANWKEDRVRAATDVACQSPCLTMCAAISG